MPRDRQAAVTPAKPAAEAGDAFAEEILGSAYARGIGVNRDDKTAFHHSALAAARGPLNAGYNCAIDYLRGEGVQRNEAKGVRLLRYRA